VSTVVSPPASPPASSASQDSRTEFSSCHRNPELGRAVLSWPTVGIQNVLRTPIWPRYPVRSADRGTLVCIRGSGSAADHSQTAERRDALRASNSRKLRGSHPLRHLGGGEHHPASRLRRCLGTVWANPAGSVSTVPSWLTDGDPERPGHSNLARAPRPGWPRTSIRQSCRRAFIPRFHGGRLRTRASNSDLYQIWYKSKKHARPRAWSTGIENCSRRP